MCTNIAYFYFNRSIDAAQAQEIYNKLGEIVEMDCDEEYVLDELESSNESEIGFISKWIMPKEQLKQFSKENKCKIVCVAYEWGCNYADSDEFNGLEE